MTVSFELSQELEQSLRGNLKDVGAEAKEAFLVAQYRLGRLTRAALSRALGIDRFETEDVLHKHQVTEDLGTIDDYVEDIGTLAKIRAERP